MSRVNLASDLFLGEQELAKILEIQNIDHKLMISLGVKSYGIFKAATGDTNLNFLVEEGTNADTIKIANPSRAIDKDLNIINQIVLDNIEIPTDDGVYYWLRVKYAENYKEEGTISVDVAGNVIGIGTKFTETLRAGSLPSKIKFIDSTLNAGEYTVLNVLDDTNIIIGGAFTVETTASFGIIGTFTPGFSPQTSDKFPFRYNDCTLEWVVETVADTPPIDKLQDYEFFVARVNDTAGTIIIEDKRVELYTTIEAYNNSL